MFKSIVLALMLIIAFAFSVMAAHFDEITNHRMERLSEFITMIIEREGETVVVMIARPDRYISTFFVGINRDEHLRFLDELKEFTGIPEDLLDVHVIGENHQVWVLPERFYPPFAGPIIHYQSSTEALLEYPNRFEYRRSRLLYGIYFSIEHSGEMRFQYIDRFRSFIYSGTASIGRALDADNLLEDAREVSYMILADWGALDTIVFEIPRPWWHWYILYAGFGSIFVALTFNTWRYFDNKR